MHLQFLGTGSAFTTLNFQTNFILRANGKRLLLDCGGDIRHSMENAGYTHRAIDEVYISHQHADHVGGLEWLAFMTYFDPKCKPIPLHLAEDIDDLWHDYLKISLQYLMLERAESAAFFKWDALHIPPPNDEGLEPEIFRFGHLRLQPVPVRHVPGGSPAEDMMAYGLRIWGPEEPKVFWTADTTFDPDRLMPHYEWADRIIHDCETSCEEEGVQHAIKSGVHAHYWDLVGLPEEIKNKMYLVHYQDNVLGYNSRVLDDWAILADAHGFAGFVEPASELVLVPLDDE